MKWQLCAVLALSVGSGVYAAERQLNWAEKMLSELSHDFGVVTHGADVRHQIKIHNPYAVDVRIVDVGTTCGCTAGSASKSVLKPNESAVIDVVMNTVKFKRHKHSNVDVTLSYGAGNTVKVRIPIHAYIRDDVIASTNTVDFGTVNPGEAPAKTVTVDYRGNAPWKITGVRAADDSVNVKISEPQRINGMTRYTLQVSLNPSSEPRSIDRKILVLTEEPNQSYLPLTVKATVESPVVVANPVIQLGTVTPGTAKSARIVIRGREPFAIAKIDAANQATSPQVSDDLRQVHVIPVTVVAPSTPGQFTQEFTVTVAGQEQPLTCRIEGNVSATSSGVAATEAQE